MREMLQFYVDGEWIDPVSPQPFEVINPATGEQSSEEKLASTKDVNQAVENAKNAFEPWANTPMDDDLITYDALLVPPHSEPKCELAENLTMLMWDADTDGDNHGGQC